MIRVKFRTLWIPYLHDSILRKQVFSDFRGVNDFSAENNYHFRNQSQISYILNKLICVVSLIDSLTISGKEGSNSRHIVLPSHLTCKKIEYSLKAWHTQRMGLLYYCMSTCCHSTLRSAAPERPLLCTLKVAIDHWFYGEYYRRPMTRLAQVNCLIVGSIFV